MDYPKNWVDEKFFGVGNMFVWVRVFTIFPIRFWTIPRFSASSSSTVNDVCVRFSRVRTRTQATAMVARPICADVCVCARRVEPRRRYYAENRDGHFPFCAVFSFFSFFVVRFSAFCLFDPARNSFAVYVIYCKNLFDAIRLLLSISLIHSEFGASVSMSHFDSTHSPNFWAGKFIYWFEPKCLLGANFCRSLIFRILLGS